MRKFTPVRPAIHTDAFHDEAEFKVALSTFLESAGLSDRDVDSVCRELWSTCRHTTHARAHTHTHT